ncbi:DUF6371 domain-containing protein [Aestuariibaculum sp. M13]|uniref:DUF6371 domain-containing protein n=1 Tax=Aestuariibaculum sp. M13 TaxID=2967132 RepID=UPI002159CDA9|nr:DUF6371 domain-containing protein [Aestuariibaculum sp. M13]MCR8667415.1 DUF6371 domain-containing protein [Aestuariibaculum sp. M13]
MLQKLENNLQFEVKRNKKLVTPCCNRSNKDGKFANFKGFPEVYGYCHSCGTSTLPPTLYRNDLGAEFVWNEEQEKFVEADNNTISCVLNSLSVSDVNTTVEKINKQFIENDIVQMFLENSKENNLLTYLRNRYGDLLIDEIKLKYLIGTSRKGGTVFWNINVEGKAQKAKVVYYTNDGKRTDYFQVPYKNQDGYYSCLFGEHLIKKSKNRGKTLVLVESEKTALVCSLHLPEYVWLAYGGINGLTTDKLNVLVGYDVILVPDMSNNAVSIMENKLDLMKDLGVKVKIWDMTKGKTDDQLKEEGWYNCDLEDVFRYFN